MEKPDFIDIMSSLIESDIEESKKKGIEVDYYATFIEFLEKEKKDILLKGSSFLSNETIRKQTGLNVGIEQIEYGIKYLKNEQKKEKGQIILEKGTARQSSIAFYYLYQSDTFPATTGENSTDARFIHFLTGHDFDTLRKIIHDPFTRKMDKTGKATKSLLTDFIKVRNQFEKINFNKGVQLIEKDIKMLQNDLDSYEMI